MDNKKFLIFGNVNYTIIDKKRNMIISLKNGTFEDITKKCEKMYKKQVKNKKVGSYWYEFLIEKISRSSAYIWEDEIKINTNDQIKFDKMIFNLKGEQIEILLKNLKRNLKKLEEQKQYYTYDFSNC